MNEPAHQLTPSGEDRRDTILRLASQALEGRVRRRRARRAGAAALLLAAAAIGILLQRGRDDSPGRTGPREFANIPVRVGPSTDAVPRGVELISDEQLVQELAAVGIKAGLVRIGAETRLVADDGREIRPRDRLILPASS